MCFDWYIECFLKIELAAVNINKSHNKTIVDFSWEVVDLGTLVQQECILRSRQLSPHCQAQWRDPS